jgi:predicted aldo/keto reductase-like oxidoreductase
MHSVKKVSLIDHKGYHAAVEQLKSEGRLKYTGLSSHGPSAEEEDSMEKVLCAAAEDGRFDVMLLVYNFMNKEAGEKILAACKKNNVGTTAMKTAPGVVEIETFDPENPTEEQEKWIQDRIKRGSKREDLVQRLLRWVDEQKENHKKTIPFMEKYGLKTEDQLFKASIQWVLQNPDMHTVCVGFRNLDIVDKVVPLSGTKLSKADAKFLEQYKFVYHNYYCRHSCNKCVNSCSKRLPVSKIMRYAYYFNCQGREKYAMQKYANLNGRDASSCFSCEAPCLTACPYNVNIQANLMQAHSLLKLV